MLKKSTNFKKLNSKKLKKGHDFKAVMFVLKLLGIAVQIC